MLAPKSGLIYRAQTTRVDGGRLSKDVIDAHTRRGLAAPTDRPTARQLPEVDGSDGVAQARERPLGSGARGPAADRRRCLLLFGRAMAVRGPVKIGWSEKHARSGDGRINDQLKSLVLTIIATPHLTVSSCISSL